MYGRNGFTSITPLMTLFEGVSQAQNNTIRAPLSSALNVIGGGEDHVIQFGVNSILRWGQCYYWNYNDIGRSASVEANYATVLGGDRHAVTGDYAVVLGGDDHRAGGDYSYWRR